MKRSSVVFLGTLTSAALSFFVLIYFPYAQLGALAPAALDASMGVYYPGVRPGQASQGKDVYRANGCQYCHTQQVLPLGVSYDLNRGWGKRWSVARDYLFDDPVLLGNLRLGSDLANIGTRKTNDVAGETLNWHLVHLYNPRIVAPGSAMPAYPYLFEKRKLSGTPSASALKFPAGTGPDKGFEIVPKPSAIQLASYLFNLQATNAVYEAYLPLPPKPATNAAPETPAPSK